MLILREISRRHLPCLPNVCYQSRHLATKTKEKSKDILADFKMKLPAALPKKPKREPFVKNFFLGVVDTDFLAYPEPQHCDRYNEFQEWFKPIKEYMKSVDAKEFEETGEIPAHVIQNFKDLGVFGTRIHEDYRGTNLLHSEFLQVLEVVSKVPALGLYFLKQSVPPVDIFNKYGTVEQKLKYLPKIATGQSLATVAITEKDSPGTDNLLTTSTLSETGDFWIIDGEKSFVANAKYADAFLVVGHASLSGNIERRPETLTTFLVDRNTEGFHVAEDSIQMVGLKGFNASRIIMKGVKIPKENIIGQIGDSVQHLINLFTSTRHLITPIAIAILKQFLELLVADALQRKHFNKNLHDTEIMKSIISDITASIYSMESMLYMTTAMMDLYEDQDVLLETALTEQFCVQECLIRIIESMWIVGPRAATLVAPFERLFRDTFTVANYETSLLDTKMYSSLLGVQHYGLAMSGEVKKERNPFLFPKNNYLRFFFSDNTLKLHLEEYFHPSLQQCADCCDRCLFLLKDSTRFLLFSNGVEITDRHASLAKLSDMASKIYAYIANITRTSRSYCIGNKDSDYELRLTLVMAYRLEQQIKQLAEDLTVSRYENGDYSNNEIADQTMVRKGYIGAHPLQRNY